MTVPPLSTVPARARAVTDAVAALNDRRSDIPAGWKFRTKATPYLFLLPYAVITAVFFIYPLVYATVLAFYQTNGPARRAFVGLDNFHFVLRDADFHRALWNTIVFTI